MRVLIERLRHVSRMGLGLAVGVISLGTLVAVWNAPGTRANAAKPFLASTNKRANITNKTLSAIQGPVCVAPPAGMISWWTGDGNANDLQDGNDGTLVNGATFAAGMVGQAFSLDGVNDRVDVPDADNLDLTSQMTIDAWINPTALGGHIVDKITPGGSDGYLLDTFGGKVRFVFGSQEISGTTTLQTNVFTHVAATYDFSTLNVYVDGVLDGTLLAEELALPPNNLPLRIGADQTGASTFSGLIDEVEIFNRALSEQEILSIVTAGSAGKCKSTCVLTCPSDISQPNDKGQCGALVNFAPMSSACGSVTCTPPSDSFFAVGTAVVTCTAATGAKCSFNVTVDDTEPPVFNSCPGNISASTSGACEIVNYTTPTAMDNCGSATVSCAPASGFCFPLGTTTVTCTASDPSPNNADAVCEFTVTVDACPINCPANIMSNNAAGQCGATVTFNPTAPPSCGAVICTPASGSFFPVGTTTVTCSTKGGGNCSFTVTVNDTQAPTVSCPPNVTQPNDSGQCAAVVTYANATANDNCSVKTPACAPPSGSSFPKGVTTVTCTVSDPSGNTGSCMFTVTVNDTQAPTITCPANITKPNDPNQCSAAVSYPTPTASDNCPGAPTVTCAPASGSNFPKGTTTVTCSATDMSGNSSSCTFTVTVNDTQAPTITCPATVIAVTPAPGQPGTVVTFPPPTASDNCPGVTTTCSPASGSTFPVGTSTVTCTATDASGNTATCSFGVTTFDVCLQDDSIATRVLLFNSFTGDYIFCCGQFTLSGRGSVTKQAGNITLQHNTSDRRVLGKITTSARTGAGSLQSPPGVTKCTIADRDTRNNSCVCGM